jgi:hypothetical protein
MYHARAANLVWLVEKTSAYRQVESIIAEILTSPDHMDREASYHAFGALWRLTGSPLSLIPILGTTIDAAYRGQQPPRVFVESSTDDYSGHTQE